MDNIKIPAIGFVIGFFLTFMVNLIVGNPFGSVLLRSLIYGILVFFVLFCIAFLFKNILGIELDKISEGNAKKEKEDSSSVDVVVDDQYDTAEEPREYSDNDKVTEVDNAESDVGDDDDFGEDFDTPEDHKSDDASKDFSENDELGSRSEKGSSIDDVEEIDSLDDSEKKLDDVSETRGDNTNENGNETGKAQKDDEDALDEDILELSSGEDGESEENDAEDSYSSQDNLSVDSGAASLKDAVGVDVSYDDIAKAIRTKMREDSS